MYTLPNLSALQTRVEAEQAWKDFLAQFPVAHMDRSTRPPTFTYKDSGEVVPQVQEDLTIYNEWGNPVLRVIPMALIMFICQFQFVKGYLP